MAEFAYGYEIEHDVPHRNDHGGQFFYPFPDMEPGDSFMVPLEDEEFFPVRERVRMAGWRYCKIYAPEWRVSVAREYDESSGRKEVIGVRLWMLERDGDARQRPEVES